MGKKSKQERRRLKRKEKQRKARANNPIKPIQIPGGEGISRGLQNESVGICREIISGRERLAENIKKTCQRLSQTTAGNLADIFKLVYDLDESFNHDKKWNWRVAEIQKLKEMFQEANASDVYDQLLICGLINEPEMLDPVLRNASTNAWPFSTKNPLFLNGKAVMTTEEMRLPFMLFALSRYQYSSSRRKALVSALIKTLSAMELGPDCTIDFINILSKLFLLDSPSESLLQSLDSFFKDHHYCLDNGEGPYQAILWGLPLFLDRSVSADGRSVGGSEPHLRDLKRWSAYPHILKHVFRVNRYLVLAVTGGLLNIDPVSAAAELTSFIDNEISATELSFEDTLSLQLTKLKITRGLMKADSVPAEASNEFAKQGQVVLGLLSRGVPKQQVKLAQAFIPFILDFLLDSFVPGKASELHRAIFEKCEAASPLDFRAVLLRFCANPNDRLWINTLKRRQAGKVFHHYSADLLLQAVGNFSSSEPSLEFFELFYDALSVEQRKEFVSKSALYLGSPEFARSSGSVSQVWQALSRICVARDQKLFSADRVGNIGESELLFVLLAAAAESSLKSSLRAVLNKVPLEDLQRAFCWCEAKCAPSSLMWECKRKIVDEILPRLFQAGAIRHGSLSILSEALEAGLGKRGQNLTGKYLLQLSESDILDPEIARNVKKFLTVLNRTSGNGNLKQFLRKLPSWNHVFEKLPSETVPKVASIGAAE